ncbi:MAG: hypothetical protein EBV79_12355 [Betaproteobacteria bacterium]|nr:hypothetical protein [Betaproteobacteria bacterium]
MQGAHGLRPARRSGHPPPPPAGCPAWPRLVQWRRRARPCPGHPPPCGFAPASSASTPPRSALQNRRRCPPANARLHGRGRL